MPLDPTPTLDETLSSLLSRFSQGQAGGAFGGGGTPVQGQDFGGDFDTIRGSIDELLGQQGDIQTKFGGLGGRVDTLNTGFNTFAQQTTQQIGGLGSELGGQFGSQFGEITSKLLGVGDKVESGLSQISGLGDSMAQGLALQNTNTDKLGAALNKLNTNVSYIKGGLSRDPVY